MRRLVAWLAGALGGIALYRLAARARAPLPTLPETAPEPDPHALDPRAHELRAKLEESRALVDERETFEAGETPLDAAERIPGDPEERRQQVHEQGRAAAERMRRRSGAPE